MNHSKYGTDKPDLRIDLIINDVTDCFAKCAFEPFHGSVIKAVVTDGYTETRKETDKMCADVETESGSKAYWFKVDENGNYVGGISNSSLISRKRLIRFSVLSPEILSVLQPEPGRRSEERRRAEENAWNEVRRTLRQGLL